jgi:hypothetical protein
MNDTEKQKIREEWNETQFTNNIWANKDVVDVEQDNICDYWLSILDKTIKSKLEAVEDIAYKVCNGDDDCIDNFTELWQEIKAELLNKHK